MKANHIYTWFFATGGAILKYIIKSDIIKLLFMLFQKASGRDRGKKNAIKNRFKDIFLEGMGNGFSKLPSDFRGLIYDAEIWGYRELSNMMSDLRFAWTYASLRYNPAMAQEAGILPNDVGFFEQNRRLAVKLTDEINEALRRL